MRVSHSMLQTYRDCPRKYMLGYLERLEKIREGWESHDSAWGRGVHKGLEVYYLGGSTPDMVKGFDSIYSELLDDSDKAKTPENGHKLLVEYADSHKGDFKEWEVIAAEKTIDVPIGGHVYRCGLDLVMKHRASGDYYPWDHKTTGKSLGVDFFQGYDMDFQMTGYVVACTKEYGSCGGFYINGIQVGFNSRAGSKHPAGFWWENVNRMFNRMPHQLEQWRTSVGEWVAKVEGDTTFPMNTSLCRWCEFRELDLAGWDVSKDREAVLNLYQPKGKS